MWLAVITDDNTIISKVPVFKPNFLIYFDRNFVG